MTIQDKELTGEAGRNGADGGGEEDQGKEELEGERMERKKRLDMEERKRVPGEGEEGGVMKNRRR